MLQRLASKINSPAVARPTRAADSTSTGFIIIMPVNCNAASRNPQHEGALPPSLLVKDDPVAIAAHDNDNEAPLLAQCLLRRQALPQSGRGYPKTNPCK